MKIIYIYYLLTVLLFCQCKTNQLGQIENGLKKSYSVKYLNREEFDRSRSLMFKSLSPEIVKNDSIIFLERFTSENGNYSYTIYESNTHKTKQYMVQKSVKNRRINVDSLIVLHVPDKILSLVRGRKLDEIKQRGDSTTLTPAATLIINIGIKNKEDKKFYFTTLVTQEFITLDN